MNMCLVARLNSQNLLWLFRIHSVLLELVADGQNNKMVKCTCARLNVA